MEEMTAIPGHTGYFACRSGSIYSTRNRSGELTELKPSWNGRYYNVSIYPDKGRKVSRHVHSVICHLFHGERPHGMQCRHLDGDPKNNHADNLKWGTSTENNMDRKHHGTLPTGESCYLSKLKRWEVHEIRELKLHGVRERVLAAAYGVSQSAIKHATNGRSWA